MAKFNSSDILGILRKFEVASEDNVPRNIEELKKITADEFSEIFLFKFLNTKYIVTVDGTAEDDENYILGLLNSQFGDIEGELLKNPKDDLMSFAMPFKGKEVYIFKSTSSRQRLDLVMSEMYPDISRSSLQKYIKSGYVTVNKKVIEKPKKTINRSDNIELNIPEKEQSEIDIPVIYEDENVVVIDKPAGVLSHSKGVLNNEFTAADLFLAKGSKFANGTNRAGIVHRLDRDTSGVMLGSKTAEAASKIQKQFSDRTTKKIYIAIVHGHLSPKKAVIDLPIARNPSAPSTFKVDIKGKSAQTSYEVLAENNEYSLVKLMPKTGRTHQLRVHLAYMKTPILGDRVYSKDADNFDRMYLHANSLELSIPPNSESENSQRKVFTSDLPNSFNKLVNDNRS